MWRLCESRFYCTDESYLFSRNRLSGEDFEEAAINPRWTGVGATVLNSDDKYSGAKSLKSPARAAQAIRTKGNLDLTKFASLTKTTNTAA